MKNKSKFVCQSCGYISFKWQGKCHECGEWNSFLEEVEFEKPKEGRARLHDSLAEGSEQISLITEIVTIDEKRTETEISEFDRVLGGGLIPGMFILIGGDPGIGKSTLVLQICKELSKKNKKTIYITGEESPSQIKLRAERLNALCDNIYIYPEISFEKISKALTEFNPFLVIVDSIQTMATSELSGTPGSVGQIREVAARFMMYAKKKNIPIIIVGHVTKDGMIAGPKVLEHMVDTVLYFEGDTGNRYRILRAVKNRFGSTNEIGVFEMTSNGLEAIKNPSELFINEGMEKRPGSIIIPTIEGTRPILVELQALVSTTNYGVAKRTTVGVDPNRVSMLLAVIEKHMGIAIGSQDVFLNIVGGVKVNDTAMDMGIILAILSSYKDKEIRGKVAVIGEVGLTGEVRAVSSVDSRITEAIRLGFDKIILPEASKIKNVEKYNNVEFLKIKKVTEINKLQLF